MIEDNPYVRIGLVDEKTGKEIISIGIIADRSKTSSCPRISAETAIPFSLEDITDPLHKPYPIILTGKNPFRVRPCSSCDRVTVKGEFKPRKGSENKFKCVAYNGSVTETGYYPSGTSQQNLSSIPLE